MTARATISCVISGETPKSGVNGPATKYFSLLEFGFLLVIPHSGPRKRGVSRSSRTRAGRRWTLVTSARTTSQGGQP
ncbi:hypothetical protein BF49_6321 [Bradyrhizobium sp.]|nr:hypothetical protein BF49_6321 [Bradyrhizobium sp.]